MPCSSPVPYHARSLSPIVPVPYTLPYPPLHPTVPLPVPHRTLSPVPTIPSPAPYSTHPLYHTVTLSPVPTTLTMPSPVPYHTPLHPTVPTPAPYSTHPLYPTMPSPVPYHTHPLYPTMPSPAPCRGQRLGRIHNPLHSLPYPHVRWIKKHQVIDSDANRILHDLPPQDQRPLDQIFDSDHSPFPRISDADINLRSLNPRFTIFSTVDATLSRPTRRPRRKYYEGARYCRTIQPQYHSTTASQYLGSIVPPGHPSTISMLLALPQNSTKHSTTQLLTHTTTTVTTATHYNNQDCLTTTLPHYHISHTEYHATTMQETTTLPHCRKQPHYHTAGNNHNNYSIFMI
nr:extensin-1-like [Penaeus vannamei]